MYTLNMNGCDFIQGNPLKLSYLDELTKKTPGFNLSSSGTHATFQVRTQQRILDRKAFKDIITWSPNQG